MSDLANYWWGTCPPDDGLGNCTNGADLPMVVLIVRPWGTNDTIEWLMANYRGLLERLKG